MTKSRVVALVCPECEAKLSGLSTDALFGCSSCSLAFEPDQEGALRPFPVLAVDAQAAARLPLPFWQLAVTVRPAVKPDMKLDHVFIPAFDMRRRSYFGDPGLEWTLQGLEPKAAPTRQPLAGVTLAHDDALALAPYYAYRAVDEIVDVTGLDLSIDITRATVLLVDFVDEGEALKDPLGGGTYPRAAFCDLPSLRAAALLTKAQSGQSQWKRANLY